MSIKSLTAAALALALLGATGCGPGQPKSTGGVVDSTGRTIGRMKVSVMPEYDDPGVLVVYDGRFAEASGYPIRTSFFVPRGSVISDACSLSHEGQHFCQLYKTSNRGSYDEVSLVLPYPNFYLSFHTPRIEAQGGAKNVDYRLRLNNAVRSLEVDVQQPLRSADFRIQPPAGAVKLAAEEAGSLIQGFVHEAFRIEALAPQQEVAFQIQYSKADPLPSVDIKYTTAAMREPQNLTSSYDTQRNVKAVIYGVAGAGLGLLLGVGAWYLRARRRRTEKP